MPKYNPIVIEKIVEKTGLSRPTIYRKINEAEHRLGVEGNTAALQVAIDHRVPIKRISTSQERTEVAKHRIRTASERVIIQNPPNGNKHQRPRKLASPEKKTNPKQVFLIHGRNSKLNSSINSFLRSISLQPVEFSSAIHSTIRKLKSGGNPYIGDILDVTFQRVKVLIVLFSPDDEVQLRKQLWSKSEKRIEKKLTPQARPNVIFEAGLAYGRYPEKTLFLAVGKTKQFSDIAGRHMLHLDNSTTKRRDFANRLAAMGCEVDLGGDDWESVGEFQA